MSAAALVIYTSLSRRRRTRATRCVTTTVLYTTVDAQCDKLATVVGRTQLATPATVDVPRRNFISPDRVSNKIPEESDFIFRRYRYWNFLIQHFVETRKTVLWLSNAWKTFGSKATLDSRKGECKRMFRYINIDALAPLAKWHL